MKTQSEDESESHEIVDKLEEREMLWNQFTQRSDCEHCPRKSFKGLEANRILEELGLEVAASAGAACH